MTSMEATTGVGLLTTEPGQSLQEQLDLPSQLSHETTGEIHSFIGQNVEALYCISQQMKWKEVSERKLV